MIDFVKILIIVHNIDWVKNHPVLDFNISVCESTGEMVEDTRTFTWKGIEFELINLKYLYIRGSLHKFRQGGTNWDRFPFAELFTAIKEICETLGLSPYACKLENIELGVNLHNPKGFTAPKVISNLKDYKGDEFSYMKSNRVRIGKEVYKQRYGLKIYDKGKQQNPAIDDLRYEIKVLKMIHLEECGIHALADLLDPDKLRCFGAILCATINELIIFDPLLKKSPLTKLERELIKWGRNPHNWTELADTNRRKYRYRRTRFNEITLKYIPVPIREKLYNAVSNEIENLLKFPPEMWSVLTAFLDQYKPNPGRNYCPVLSLVENPIVVGFNTSYSMLKSTNTITTSTRRCKVCKRDISHRRKDADFCSSKSCRNADSNRRNNYRRKYGSDYGLSLF